MYYWGRPSTVNGGTHHVLPVHAQPGAPGPEVIASRAVCTLMLLVIFIPGAPAQTGEFEYGLSPVYGTPRSPEIDLDGLDGKRHRLSDYSGSVILVNFWATWCPPCVQEMPTLQELADLLGDENFEILAVNLGEEKKQIDDFLKKFSPALEVSHTARPGTVNHGRLEDPGTAGHLHRGYAGSLGVPGTGAA